MEAWEDRWGKVVMEVEVAVRVVLRGTGVNLRGKRDKDTDTNFWVGGDLLA